MSEQNQLEYKDYTKKRNKIVAMTTDYQKQKLEKMKKQLPKYLTKRSREFAEEYNRHIERIESGEYFEDPSKIPLYELTEHTFKPLIKVAGITPLYSADELALALDFYKDCCLKLNKNSLYIPKIEDYCRLLGISKNKFKEMKNTSSDENVREVCNQVEDYCVAILADASLSEKVEKVYAIFHQKSSNGQRDNDPVQNNTFVANNTILSDSQFQDLARRYQNFEE